MLLKELISKTNNAQLIGGGDVEISGIEYDSRRIEPGMLFVAVDGFKLDGNKFIPEAVEKGAVAVLTSKPVENGIPRIVVPDVRKAASDIAAAIYGYPGQALDVVGVTGTNGKSTSVYLIKGILEANGKKSGMINSLVYDNGKEKIKANRTTPEAIDVQRLLFQMKNNQCQDAVVEVSSHALVLNRVENIDFKVGLFTTFSRDHLDFHNSMEEYLDAKKSFLLKLAGEKKYAVINLDVPEFVSFLEEPGCRHLTYSAEGKPADVRAENIDLQPEKTQFTLLTGAGEQDVELYLPGRFNLTNALGAAAAGIALGIDPDVIADGLKKASPVPGRFVPVKKGQSFTVLIDYAHTPDAIERLCQSAREITKGRLMILFGCGGDRDRGKRPLMGKAATANSDFAVVTSDNPRTENPERIVEDIMPGIVGSDYKIIIDRREAIDYILAKAQPGDTVLLAGKGAEDYLEIGTERFPYEDKVEAIKTLEKLGYKG